MKHKKTPQPIPPLPRRIPGAGELLDCDPDPMAGIFLELTEHQQWRAQNQWRPERSEQTRLVEALEKIASTSQAKPLGEVENLPLVAPVTSRRSRRDPEVTERRAHIRSIGDVPDATYWEMMDAKYRTPASWQAWGCPASYVTASKHKNKEIRDHFLGVQKDERKNARRAPRQKHSG